jgi:hypothetical protein
VISRYSGGWRRLHVVVVFEAKKRIFGPNRLSTRRAELGCFDKVDEEISWPFAMEHVVRS